MRVRSFFFITFPSFFALSPQAVYSKLNFHEEVRKGIIKQRIVRGYSIYLGVAVRIE